ncbi:iron-siderophore ABC transporter substrate-binding protein [Sporosarcina trichiuri]|uniref:iron-siderophore ABC transporter substrate-binding protein n=1 Tax=Sporosarcina trichiuri TaxID=3056445 RepID=UPI0025B5E1E6|nr:iron-siderophore ABC transporter substrate-binding protein [Sporosarcina sp. 0.2-SM1T-5]WJY27217.1 iron-siderophore ABC transporter substrate-binding protein [Sporosarcina sp. 0.2-SM1T-5]
MNAKKKLSISALLTAFLMMLLLAGCSGQKASESKPAQEPSGSGDPSETDTSEDAADDTQYPITIKHAFGETVIESKPERVATVQWANHDVALALGVVPVGFSAANYGVQDDSGMLPWTAERLKELDASDPNIYQDTDGLDFEAISDSKPDVILAAYSGITQEDYDTLSEIAPVIAYPDKPWATTWREQVLLNSEGMGMKQEGEQLIKDTEEKIQQAADKYPQLKGKTVAWVNFSAQDMSKLHLYTPADPRGEFLNELGMDYPKTVTDAITDPDSYSFEFSAENADLLNDADIIVGYGGNDLYEAVKADPLFGKIPAIERGSIVFIGDNTPLAASGNPNPLSIAYTLDDYVKLLADAADKVND